MWGNSVAEMSKLVRRPATWLLLGIAITLSLTFTYLVDYASYASGGDEVAGPGGPARGLAALLPDQLVGNSIGGLPVFLGAITLILGVLVAGSEYGWGTWKTVLTQGPSRLSVFSGKLVALAVANLVLVVVMFGIGAATSGIIAGVENQPVDWPSAIDLAIGVGAGWLVAATWTALGVLLAIALRGVALALGLGLVWMLAVQNLLSSLAAPLLDWVADAQKALPGPNAGSLTASLGSQADTPGVAELVGSGQATAVLVAYLIGFAGLAAVLFQRRDVL